MAKTEGRRARPEFTDGFKAGAVRFVLDEVKSAGAVAPCPRVPGPLRAKMGPF